MTTNIYLAKLLGAERERELLDAAKAARRAKAARGPRTAWRDRLHWHRDEPRPQVTGDTWIAA